MRKKKQLTSPARGIFICGHCCDAQFMICRKLAAVQDFGPGVAVTSHDGCTASLDGFAQAAAGVDEPGEGMGLQHLWTPPGSRLRVEPWHHAAHCSARRAVWGSLMSFERSCPGSKQWIFEDRRDEG